MLALPRECAVFRTIARRLGPLDSVVCAVVTTKDISTSIPVAACDVCGRTLLRGERAENYVDGGELRSVCALCVTRAIQEGWVREGATPDQTGAGARYERRRSLLSRLRSRGRPARATTRRSANGAPRVGRPPANEVREPRHVRAIPASPEHKLAAAIEAFNASEHPRTVVGVSRALGAPTVAILPVDASPSLVNVTVSWELCWYRYQVNLSDEVPDMRRTAQGYELSELPDCERRPNAVSDEYGELHGH